MSTGQDCWPGGVAISAAEAWPWTGSAGGGFERSQGLLLDIDDEVSVRDFAFSPPAHAGLFPGSGLGV